MTGLVIFASYDKSGIVHDYVITYLNRLKQVADKIIFIADNEATETEKQKLNGLVDYAEFSPHGEYDFGSYKRGFIYAEQHGWLNQADELILCNDSCFCVSSLEPVFATMSKKTCDFWGMTKSHEIQDHLQSYFLVFKKNVFTHTEFVSWIKSVTKQINVDNVIKFYELPLAHFFENLGFVSEAFIKSREKSNPTTKPITLLKQNMPLIKKKVFSLRDACEEPVNLLLVKLKQKHYSSYKDICRYYKTIFSCLFPMLLPYSFDKLKRFLFQKKITKSKSTIIKICKIPVYISKREKK